MAILLLYTVGRPVRTSDAWLHLKLGEAYARDGLSLSADPILYTAQGPPTATAWLSDLTLYAIHAATGFQGLRVAHVLVVVGILVMTGSLLRRASGSAALASLGTAIFIALAGFRLLQLRPHLVTIGFALLLYRLLLESPSPPSRRRIAMGALLLGLWANAHAGFVLGPMLLLAATGGVLLAALVGPSEARPAALARTRALGLALAFGFLATFANPDGAAPHLAYLSAGDDSPALDLVRDEWRRFPFFGPLRPGLPPSAVGFVASWLLIAATALVGAALLARWKRRDASDADPALVAIACAGALATALAVRFQWMGIFALLLVARFARAHLTRLRARPVAALAAVALAVGWIRVGDWPRLREGVPRHLEGYAAPYSLAYYFGHTTWFLRDAGIEGHLFNRYVVGNFLGYWLAPELRLFIAGSLNVPPDVADAYFALNDRRGPGELGFEETLDRYTVDVFMGVGVPVAAQDARPQVYTTTHLEGAPGWIPIFRNLRSGVWLRKGARNEANLARVAAYYDSIGVPFDPQMGFDAERVVLEMPRWAALHGMVPADYRRLLAHADARGVQARRGLAMAYAALGLYERAIALDRGLLAQGEEAGARRRLVWSLLHLGRAQEALAAALPFERSAPPNTLARRLATAAREYAALGSKAERAAMVAKLRVFTGAEARSLFARFLEAMPR